MTLLPRTLLGRTLLVLVVTVAITELATQLVFRQFVIEQYGQSLVRTGTNNFIAIAVTLNALPPGERTGVAQTLGKTMGLRITPAVGGAGPPASASEVLPERLLRARERLRERLGPGVEVRVDTSLTPPHGWIRLPVAGGDWWVEFERNSFDRVFPLSAALLLGISLALATAVAWLTVRRLNRPLREVQGNILALSRGAELPYPLRDEGPAELSDLARAVARTAAVLRQNEQERALLLAGVSHDLRTPLSRVRLAVELMNDPSLEERQALVGDLEEIDRIIDQFLDFARNPESSAAAPADLCAVARDCGTRAAQRIEGLSLELDDALPTWLRRPAFDRLIGNLLENARRYAAPPIVLRARREGRRAVLSVLDRGPGIPPEQVARLLQPFTRLDASRTGPGGAGLGLAIVDRIARAHGSRLELLPREGGGLEARVVLPLDPDGLSGPR